MRDVKNHVCPCTKRTSERASAGTPANTLQAKGAWQQVTRIEDLCSTHVSRKWPCHLDACAGSVLARHTTTSPMCREDVETERGQYLASAAQAAPSWALSWNTEKAAEPPKLRGDTARARSRCGMWLKTRRPRPPDIFTTAAVPGRGAALDVCVASSNAAAARGDSAQASFDRKLSHNRDEISELRNQDIHCPSRLDSGRATTPIRHSDTAVCNRHCIQPERQAEVGEIFKLFPSPHHHFQNARSLLRGTMSAPPFKAQSWSGVQGAQSLHSDLARLLGPFPIPN